MIGRTIQNYHVEELLGEGGMGTVYRGTDTLLRRPVAIKMLHPHLLKDSTFMERFRNEAVLSAQLNHPNVATLYNLLHDRTDNLMVMELVDGYTIERLLTKHGKLSLETTFRIIAQALDGLQHAHNKGILHRDIKPANLMLTHEGVVKLMDFGIARLVGSQRLTRADRVVGTLEYMAPELLNGAEPSVQSDLYAMGVLMYEMLSGKMPFEPTTESTLITQILTKKPIPIRNRIADLPRSVEEILDKLLQKKPEKRFEKASELKYALLSVVAAGPIVWQTAEGKSGKTLPATKLANAQPNKPQVGPTRLASSISDTVPKKTSKLQSQLLSLEGLILLGAIVIALGIIGFWFVNTDPTPTSQVAQDTTTHSKLHSDISPTVKEIAPDSPNVAAENRQLITTPSTTSPVVSLPPAPKQIEPEPTEPKTQKPVRKKESPKTQKPVRKKESPKTPVQEKPREEAPVAVSPKEEPKPVQKEEPIVKKEPAKRNVTVEVRNEPFSVAFAQTVTSEASEGQTVWLQTVSEISVDGVTVVQTGARVRAIVQDARSSSNSQKALLSLRFEAVEAVNGQWLPVKFPEYSDKSSDQVVFQRGRRVNNLRVARSTLTLQL
ncbi:MAG TPA: hypothetical protein DCR35_09240 [Runella sp.]|nr:hypothetical protein [Runella sp.]